MPTRIRAQSTGQLSLFRELKAPSIPAKALHLDHFPGLPEDFNLASYQTIIVMFSGGKDSLACLLLVYSMLLEQGLLGKVWLEVWHHEVDGREGSHLMDWPCTPDYCRAVAQAFHLPIYFSWLEGGFEREMTRQNQPKARTWFESPAGLCSAGGESPRLGTRLKFPQVAANLSVRWCSAYLKIGVSRIALNNQSRFRGQRTLVISGERAEESPGRARYAAFEPHECSIADREIDRWRPVHHWKNRDVWRMIARFGINPHPAYRLGFGRCSCQFCIFGSDNQWATLWQIDPDRLQRLIDYEQQFGLTIHRQLSLMERIRRGTPYPNLDPLDIGAALSLVWSEPIILLPGEWRVPAGYAGELAGPG